MSNVENQRISAAMGYLDREVCRRPNLKSRAETQVRELLFDGARATGGAVRRQ